VTATLKRSPISKKKRFLNVEFYRRKQLLSLFFAVSSNFAAASKINKRRYPLRTRPLLDLSNIEIKYVARTYSVSVALRMSDVIGGCVNMDIGTMNAFSFKVEFSCKMAAR